MNENELRSCPFCGGEPKIVTYFIKGVANHTNDFATCSCGIRTRSRKNYEGALSDWNTRPIEDELRSALKRLAEVAEKEIDYITRYGHQWECKKRGNNSCNCGHDNLQAQYRALLSEIAPMIKEE